MSAIDISDGEDRRFLDDLRGLSVLRVVLGHLGLFWLFPPYTGFLHAFLPLLFFVSGVVSFGSFSRGSTGQFLAKRFLTLVTPYYLLVVVIFGCSAVGISSGPQWELGSLVQWLLLAPPGREMPFPLGQVWFLHALAIITLCSPLVFKAMTSRPWVGLIPVAISLLLGACVLFERIDRSMWVFGHNLFQPAANAGFFFLGASVLAGSRWWTRKVLWTGFAVALTFAVTLPIALNLPVDFKHHSFAPSLYYLSGSYAVIFAFLLLKKQFLWVRDKTPLLGALLKFVSKHAYPIFLLHSFFIFGAERWFGLESVMDEPLKAVAKAAFVLAATFLCAVPFTRISKLAVKPLQDRFAAGRTAAATT